MKNNFDLIFYCDSNQYSGFGHASRCSRLSAIIKKYNKNTKMGIVGDLSKKSKKLMLKTNKNLIFLNYEEKVFSRIAFIDKMFDYEDPNILDNNFLLSIIKNTEKVIVMFSGVSIKSIIKDIVYIGYQPTNNKYDNKNIFWSLKFAPTQISKLIPSIRKKNQIFLALGGNNNNKEIIKLIIAVNSIKSIKHLEVLLSPVNNIINLQGYSLRSDLKINFISDVKNLSPFLLKSTLVITSFGNLCYESIAHNTPTIIVAQKTFQADYAKLLEQENNVFSLGFPSSHTSNALQKKITACLSKINFKNKNSSICLNGLKNIANIIIKHL
tara:strand:- start:141 stop:1115 length:975 start_codon:yes stop_codon:yes gene_type:complete